MVCNEGSKLFIIYQIKVPMENTKIPSSPTRSKKSLNLFETLIDSLLEPLIKMFSK